MPPRGLLSQKEMDALMGLFDGGENGAEASACGASAPRTSAEDVRKMKTFMEACAAELAGALGMMTKQTVQVALQSILRPQQPLLPHRQSLYTVKSAAAGTLLLLCPEALMNLVNEAALGGTPRTPVPGHMPTAIDRLLFETTGALLAEVCARRLGSETGTLKRLETAPRLKRPVEVRMTVELHLQRTSLTLVFEEELFKKESDDQSV